jgi:hypothetical protein
MVVIVAINRRANASDRGFLNIGCSFVWGGIALGELGKSRAGIFTQLTK